MFLFAFVNPSFIPENLIIFAIYICLFFEFKSKLHKEMIIKKVAAIVPTKLNIYVSLIKLSNFYYRAF